MNKEIKNEVSIDMDKLKHDDVQNKIDPLSIPDLKKERKEEKFDINAMPTTSSKNTTEKSKLSIIIAASVGVLLLICIIVLIVTNSGKKLTCKYTTDDEDKISYKAVFKFDRDNNVKDLSIVMEADISANEEYKNATDKNEVINRAKKDLEESSKYSSVKVNGTKFTMTYNVKDVNQYGSKYDQVKKYMEKLKYTCK